MGSFALCGAHVSQSETAQFAFGKRVRPEALPYMKNIVFHVGLRKPLKKANVSKLTQRNFYFDIAGSFSTV